jgi:hypothetical protein
MQRIESTRKEHVVLICAILLATASGLPIAMSGKALGAVLWLGAALLALAMGITRLQVFIKPTLALVVLFAASFLIPVEIVVVRGQSFGIGWACCEVVGPWSYIEHPKPPDETTYVMVRGCVSHFGVEPSRVVKISLPEKK